MNTAMKRLGIRAAPIPGMYRSSAHGPGMVVFQPAMNTNGPSANAPKQRARISQIRRGRNPYRQLARIIEPRPT